MYGGSVTDRRADSDMERREFIGALAKQRKLLLRTVRGLSEDQVRLRPTASALCLGGLIKHVTLAEQNWCDFITQGTAAIGDGEGTSFAERATTFEMTDDETVAVLRHRHDEVALSTDEMVMALPSLDVSHPCPTHPGSNRARHGPPGASSSTSSPRPPSTPVTPTSSGSRSTAPGPWADHPYELQMMAWGSV